MTELQCVDYSNIYVMQVVIAMSPVLSQNESAAYVNKGREVI